MAEQPLFSLGAAMTELPLPPRRDAHAAPAHAPQPSSLPSRSAAQASQAHLATVTLQRQLSGRRQANHLPPWVTRTGHTERLASPMG